MDLKNESGHETGDRVWRRWRSCCNNAGMPDDCFLTKLPEETKHLLLCSFLGLYCTAKWSITGRLEGRHPQPLVASTIKAAAGCLAATFWDNLEPSPLHLSGSQNLHPSFRALFKAFNNVDRPTKCQKAITPKLLRKLLEASNHSSLLDTAPAVTAGLVIGTFFFAMRSCKYSKPATLGQTKYIDLDGLIFRTIPNTVIDHIDIDLLTEAECVTAAFVNQKNGKKMDSRTQHRTKDPQLCPDDWNPSPANPLHPPQRHWFDCHQHHRLQGGTWPHHQHLHPPNSAPDMLLFRWESHLRARFARDRKQVHPLGRSHGPLHQQHFHSKIMILGRWSSDAFLAYIRPQALEWTNTMSREMISVDSFFDVNMNHHTTPEDPRTRANRYNTPFNGPAVVIPRLHRNPGPGLSNPF
jgi:hypothetical protein